MKVRLFISNGPSGRALQRHLEDVESGPEGTGVPASPRRNRGTNQPSAALAWQQVKCFKAMAAAKVPTPQVTSDVGLAVQWVRDGAAVVGRSPGHRSGSGMWPCISEAEVLASASEGATHWLQCVEAADEYRVHVVADRAIKTLREASAARGGCGRGTTAGGSRSRRPRSRSASRSDVRPARQCGRWALDFGAVDVLVDADGKVYVLEVNTAPGIVGSSRPAPAATSRRSPGSSTHPRRSSRGHR